MSVRKPCWKRQSVARFHLHSGIRCEGKKAFDTREEAQASNKGMKAYRCLLCKMWHLMRRKGP